MLRAVHHQEEWAALAVECPVVMECPEAPAEIQKEDLIVTWPEVPVET